MNKLKGILAQNGIISNLLILVGISCFFTFLGMIIWTLVSTPNATDVDSLKIMQLIESLGMFVIPPFVLAWFCSDRPTAFLYLDKKINWAHVGMVVLFMLMIIPAINLLSYINQQMVLPKAFAGVEAWMKASEEQMAKLTEKLVSVHSLPALTFNIFLIALIPAFGEELFFRGTIQRIFRQKTSALIAIWITSVVFSAIHLQFYGFFPRMLLGVFFGYLLFWSENLWLPVVAHFTNNAIAIVFYYLKYNGYRVPNIDTIGTGGTLWLGFVSVVLGISGFYLLRNLIQKSNAFSVNS